jgi:hypothetical protein
MSYGCLHRFQRFSEQGAEGEQTRLKTVSITEKSAVSFVTTLEPIAFHNASEFLLQL